MAFTVLDLFSAAAGGWSLGMHRAGYRTVAACEWIDWRRTLYAENNPGVLIYDDVRDLTADRIRGDLGAFPDLVVGSPPCQDISSANTKGKGVEGERSGLYFEAVRIIGEGRPRWFALENSANLRTRGADRVLGALEGHGYACWSVVVGGDNIGANHERKRAWLIGCDVEQLDAHPYDQGQLRRAFHAEMGELQAVGDHSRGHDVTDAQGAGRQPWTGNHQGADARLDGRLSGHDDGHGSAASDTDGFGRDEGRSRRGSGLDLSVQENPRDTQEDGCRPGLPGRRAGADTGPEQPARRHDVHAAGFGHEGGRSWGHGPDGDCAASAPGGAGSPADADQAGQADGSLVAGLRQAEIADDGCGAGRGADRSGAGQVGLCSPDRGAAFQHRADWSLDDLARHIRLDDGLPAWLAEQRIAVGGPRGTSAASLVVEAFGDAVLPQIPEAIGRAILRVEAAYAALHHQDIAA